MPELTVIYLTSNREDPVFEQKIKDKLLNVVGRHPLISVSQKPIDFGHNICVGDVGSSYLNMFRQLQVGAEAANTEFIAVAESDQIYPLGFFDFQPHRNLYAYSNLWILRYFDKHRFVKKDYGGLIIIVRRTFLLQRLEKFLEGRPKWGNVQMRHLLFNEGEWEYFDVGAPVISIKTRNGLSRNTAAAQGVNPVHELPYHGSATDLSHYFDLFNLSRQRRNEELPIQ